MENDVERVSEAPLGVDRGCRFFHVEVWTRQGLQRFVVLFVMELSTRKVEVVGIGPAPDWLWMQQIARNLTAGDDGIVNGKRYLIHDRDPLFTAEFLKMLADTGVQSVKLPPRSPNFNANAERFVRTIKESCLDRMILFGEGSLRKAIHECRDACAARSPVRGSSSFPSL